MESTTEKYSMLKELEQKMNRLNELSHEKIRFSSTLKENPERIHKEVLGEIRNYFENDSIENRVLSINEEGCKTVGCVVNFPREKPIILINKKVADMDENYDIFQLYKEKNPDISVETFFKNIVAHEYGHILFNERFEPKMHYEFFNSIIMFSLPLELNEAFSFFLADEITGVNSPLEKLASFYTKNINFRKTMSMYDELKKLSEKGKEEVLKLENIWEMALKYESRDFIKQFSVFYKNSERIDSPFYRHTEC